MLKRLFNYPKGGRTFRSRVDRWLLVIGLAFLLLGMIFRFLEKLTSIGPESGSFLLPGIFLVILAAVGMGFAKLSGG
jgi:hypothetical protein